jgi:hypothetical protein
VATSVLYLEAARVLETQAWTDVALDTIRYVRTVLADESEALFYSSQAADEAYYQVRTRSLRRTLTPPHVDKTAFVDATSRAASAWIRAGVLTGDRTLAETGARALDRIVTRTYQPGRGVAHWLENDGAAPRGLLTDQVFASAALLDLYEATANPTWSMLAEELMRTALRELWDDGSGAFLDRVPEIHAVGQLADPLIASNPNAMAARVLARLSRLTGDPALQDRALDVLRALTPGYRQRGLFGASYALAVADVLR